jgi:hypothetical protein
MLLPQAVPSACRRASPLPSAVLVLFAVAVLACALLPLGAHANGAAADRENVAVVSSASNQLKSCRRHSPHDLFRTRCCRILFPDSRSCFFN